MLMNINKNIENATYFIERLQKDLPGMKSKAQKDFTIDMLNSFIILINTIETLQQRDPLMKVIYSLLIERMYRDMFKYSAEQTAFDLGRIFRNISEDIRNPFPAQMQKMVSFLKLEEVTHLVKLDEVDKIKDVSGDAWQQLVLKQLNYFKNQIKWN